MEKVVLFNSLGNQLEEFKPLREGKVSIYCCGPTVYNDPHIGNFRPVIVFDVLRRLFLRLGYSVKFVSNYTDVDDKIINRAKELGIDEKTLTESVIKEYRSLVEAVGSMQPDETPKPTVYMPQILNYVKELVENGSAYAVGGDVYLKVQKIPAYGELSGNSVEQLESGARIDINDKKADPLDFALWKETTEGIKWESPWGHGRPGWHTECCVMINSIFADQGGYIDIHGGGFDLKFPHHENEIAQAKAHNHHKLARYWMHNGFINVDNEKMSKSLGNVILMKDVVNEFGGIPFRMMILAAHYRAPASFSEETIKEAQKKYAQLCSAVKSAAIALQLAGESCDNLPRPVESKVVDALRDDLNTPNALAALYEDNKDLNMVLRTRPLDMAKLKEALARLLDDVDVLGIRVSVPHLSEDDKRLYGEYNDAKAAKDFAKSDEIRQQLIERGVF